MKQFWSLLNAVLFLVCTIGFVLAFVAGAPVHVLVPIAFLLALWAFMSVVMRMQRPQQQVYYVPKGVDQSLEEQEHPLEARMDDAYRYGR